MAVIKNDETTDGKFLVKANDDFGNDVEILCKSHIGARAIANVETQNQLEYFEEFKVIDGLNRHPEGLNFKEWLKSKITPK